MLACDIKLGIYLVSLIAATEIPARRFRWKHNEPKEDPIQRRNFKAEVNGTCNEELEFADAITGQIATPNFENNFYGNDSDCTWEIGTGENMKIAYEIAFLDLEPGPPFCPFDYLSVEKMVGEEWVTQADPSFLWERYCGAMRPMGFIETDTNKVKFHFVSDDYEHGRGAVINWRIYDKNTGLEQQKQTPLEEVFIDFESGWPWNVISHDQSEFESSYEWKLGRGYTNSIGTGPRKDRTTQSIFGTYAYFDTSEPRKKGDIGVFSTTPYRLHQGPDEIYCVQFYCVMYGDSFGDLETFVQYYDDDMGKLDFLSIGRISSESVPIPPTDDWLPFQYEMDPGYNGAAMASLSFVAGRGKSPQGDFAIDDLTWFKGKCETRTPFVRCAGALRNPMVAGRPVGYWNCTDAGYLGSSCNLVCMAGHMVTPGMLPENNCIEEGLFGGWEQNPKEITCQKNYCPMPSPESDGIWFFGCTDEENQKHGIITEGGSCELRCLPGYKRNTPQIIICMQGNWLQFKVATNLAIPNTNIPIDLIRCNKIEEDKLSDFEKKQIDLFKPPEQLGTDEENKPPKSTEASKTKVSTISLPDIIKTTEKKTKPTTEITTKTSETEAETDPTLKPKLEISETAAAASKEEVKPTPAPSFATPAKVPEATTASDYFDLDMTTAGYDLYENTPEPGPENNDQPKKKNRNTKSDCKFLQYSIFFIILIILI